MSLEQNFSLQWKTTQQTQMEYTPLEIVPLFQLFGRTLALLNNIKSIYMFIMQQRIY